jgi:hypothetical protein
MILKEAEKTFLFTKLSKYFNFDDWYAVKALNDLITPQTKLLIDSNNLESNVTLRDDELPILELYLDKDDFVVFTTKSLFIQRDNIYFNKTYSDMRIKKPNDEELIKLNDQNYANLIVEKRKGIHFLDVIIFLDDNNVCKLRVENGSPFRLVMLLFNTDIYLSDFHSSDSAKLFIE